MRIVTFNIKHGTTVSGSAGGGRSMRVDVGLLARTCRGFAADILALQEVDVRSARSRFRDQAAAVARATGLACTFGEAARRGPIRRYGNALLARGTIGDSEVVPLPQPARGEFRVAIIASVALTGGPTVSVGATHLSFRKGEGAVQLQVLLEALARRPAPRILLGDLNVGPDVAVPAMEAAGYTVAETGPTFPAGSPSKRIDFVAVAGLGITDAAVPEVGVSDHRPVVVEATDPLV